MHFGPWLLLGLEFELGADIVKTAVAPTWSDIGQVGAIAVIRVFFNYFLTKDMEPPRSWAKTRGAFVNELLMKIPGSYL